MFTIVLFHDPSPTEIYTLSLHDALPILWRRNRLRFLEGTRAFPHPEQRSSAAEGRLRGGADHQNHAGRRNNPHGPECSRDRKSTRLNSSHVEISYAVFCLKKKNADDDGF